MASVRIISAEARQWQAVSDAAAPELAARMSAAERNADVSIMHAGENGEPQLFEVRVSSYDEVALHAHSADEIIDEIIYVLEGELCIGRKRLGPGAPVFIAGHTLYSFQAGPHGLRLLNFRAHANTSFMKRAEFLTAKADS